MKQTGRVLFIAITAFLLPLTIAVPTHAKTSSITQEITVTATVPDHIDVVIDMRGEIIQILSNTIKNVQPTVYSMSIHPDNQRPLSEEIMKKYNSLIPAQDIKRGELYRLQSQTVLAAITVKNPVSTIAVK